MPPPENFEDLHLLRLNLRAFKAPGIFDSYKNGQITIVINLRLL